MTVRPALQVLIVDDNQADCQLMQLWLRDCQSVRDIATVSSGSKAIQYIRRIGEFISCPTPDLVLLDVNLPDMNAFEVLMELQNELSSGRIAVFVLSGTYFADDARRAIELGAQKYLAKPFGTDDFAKLVRAVDDHQAASGRRPDASS